MPVSVGLRYPEPSPIAPQCQEQKLLCVTRSPTPTPVLISLLTSPLSPPPHLPLAPAVQPGLLVGGGGGNTVSF